MTTFERGAGPIPESAMSARKDDHIRHAIEHQEARASRPDLVRNEWDDVSFAHHSLPGIDVADVDTATTVVGSHWRRPLYINAMTGGSEMSRAINRDLASIAAELDLAIAVGSMSAYLADPASAPSYETVREQHPDGFVLANVNANATPAKALSAIELIGANALQIHVNSIQEIAMREGDREFAHWAGNIAAIAAESPVPVIVKEVGFGISKKTAEQVVGLGAAGVDVSGKGGTDFAAIENARVDGGWEILSGWGQSAPASLLEIRTARLGAAEPAIEEPGYTLLASGGVRSPLEVVRGLALGADAVGASSWVLTSLVRDGRDATRDLLARWLEQVELLMCVLGARNVPALRGSDVLIRGELREYCIARGIAL
jgi:isopentenyl-diphosphate delta-isomerase